MNAFPLSFAVTATGGTFRGDAALLDETVVNVTIDSRSAGKGILYVPVIGLVFDGHRFIPDAMAAGALCTLSDRPLGEDVPHILVEDTTAALQRLSEAYLAANRVPVVGVTGSAGKTSTKEMLSAVLSRRFRTFKTPGNLNNQTGVPQAVFKVDSGCEVAVLELGTNHPGEIRSLAKIVKPDICVFTNIGVAHIEFFGDREGIFRGKTEMLEHMQQGGTIVANGDDDLLCTVPGAVLYGLGENCAVRAADLEEDGLFGTRFTLHANGDRVPCYAPAPGVHTVMNALCAAAVGLTMDMTLAECAAGIADYRPLPGRMDIRRAGSRTLIDDTYNANPGSMEASIDVLKTAKGRTVAILGDMRELGENGPAFHREVGAYAADAGISLLIAVGELSEHMAAAANERRPGMALWFPTQDLLAASLPQLLEAGDTVLVKASRGMALEHTAKAILELTE
ncbi:MAG: UDP-N-acetylmuramoyl-tripeptide--D-alanyl-D-alanine ligase [Clostridia bacterium]|nr:UDP-N-acetylmuramoyl-tripeptide--D-alanyl-D-alanine ligase [Clostridia bacterium]